MDQQFRVDTHDSNTKTPVGLKSLVYLGNDEKAARWWLENGKQGVDPQGRADAAYGLVLSRWDDKAQEYRPVDSKGFFQGQGKL